MKSKGKALESGFACGKEKLTWENEVCQVLKPSLTWPVLADSDLPHLHHPPPFLTQQAKGLEHCPTSGPLHSFLRCE